MQTGSAYRAGFTLVEIMVVVAIIGLLAAIAIPNLMRAAAKSQRVACIANLKAIESVKIQWGIDNKKNSNDIPSDADLFGANLYIRVKPSCPGGGTYTLNAVGTPASCTAPGHVSPEN